MKANAFVKLVGAVAVVFCCGVALTGCGGAKTTAPMPVHSTVQEQPTTQAQAQAATRGVKLEKEECEEKTLEPGTPPRNCLTSARSERVIVVPM